MNSLKKWLEFPINALLWIAIFAGIAMMIHVSVDVGARFFLNITFGGTNEIVSAFYMVAIAYLPWIWICRNEGHITVDLFTQMMPGGMRRFFDIVARIGTIVYVGVFTWQTGVEAFVKYSEGEVWETSYGFVPVWPSRFILPVAGFLMAVYVLLDLLSPSSEPRKHAAEEV
ncbi:MAG: TRAP transporter small permease [Beijerinckiaceae bacterium]